MNEQHRRIMELFASLDKNVTQEAIQELCNAVDVHYQTQEEIMEGLDEVDVEATNEHRDMHTEFLTILDQLTVDKYDLSHHCG